MRPAYKAGDLIPVTELPSELMSEILKTAQHGLRDVVVSDIWYIIEPMYLLKWPCNDGSKFKYKERPTSSLYVDNAKLHNKYNKESEASI